MAIQLERRLSWSIALTNLQKLQRIARHQAPYRIAHTNPNLLGLESAVPNTPYRVRIVRRITERDYRDWEARVFAPYPSCLNRPYEVLYFYEGEIL